MSYQMKVFWICLSAYVLTMSTAFSMPASLRAAGMGGAATAYPQDTLTTVDNPANAVDISRRIDLGFSWCRTNDQLTISNRPNNTFQHGEFDPYHSDQFFGHAGMNFWLDPCIVVGIAFHNEMDIHTRYGVPLADFAALGLLGQPLGPNARFEYTVNTLTLSIAHPFLEYHSIGLNVDIDFARLAVAGLGRIAFPPIGVGPLSNSPENVTDKGHQEGTGVGVTIGWLGYLFPNSCPGLSFGIAYSPSVWFHKMRKYEGLLADHRLGVPAKLRLGVAWDVLSSVAVALDIEFLNYSRIRSWSNRFPGNSTTGIGALFGTHHGPGFGWRDQCIVKLGFDWQLCPRWTVRGGYRYESPLWADQGSAGVLNVLTFQTIQNYVTAGITWHLDNCFELTAFGEYGFPGRRHTQLPSITTPLGTPIFTAGDFYLKAEKYRAGFIYGLRY